MEALKVIGIVIGGGIVLTLAVMALIAAVPFIMAGLAIAFGYWLIYMVLSGGFNRRF